MPTPPQPATSKSPSGIHAAANISCLKAASPTPSCRTTNRARIVQFPTPGCGDWLRRPSSELFERLKSCTIGKSSGYTFRVGGGTTRPRPAGPFNPRRENPPFLNRCESVQSVSQIFDAHPPRICLSRPARSAAQRPRKEVASKNPWASTAIHNERWPIRIPPRPSPNTPVRNTPPTP